MDNLDYPYEAMLKTLKNALGEPPKIEPEVWCIDNLRKKLQELQELQELCSEKIEELYWKETEARYWTEILNAA